MRKKIDRTGEVNYNTKGYKMEIINYKNMYDIDIKFEDGTIIKNTRYDHFRDGKIAKPVDRINETNIMTNGQKAKIIKYNNSNDIDIEFEDGTIVKNVSYNTFKNGKIRNNNFNSVYGVGVVGDEEVNSKTYLFWKSMLMRCYSKSFKKKNKNYNNCKVCREWMHLKNFKDLFDKNYYELGNEKMVLDKDLFNEKSEYKIYSPTTCIFMPSKINSLFKKSVTDNDLPIGVGFDKKNKKYTSYGIENNKTKHLGYYDTPEEAFYAYKEFKESYIRKIADEYKSKYPQFPQRLYEAMMNYIVEITD